MTDSRIYELLDSHQLSARFLRPVSGGDINDSFQVQMYSGETCFLKVNRRAAPPEIITTEYEGLRFMHEYGVSNIPQSVRLLQNIDTAGLLMEFYPASAENPDWDQFYSDLARMHLTTRSHFGGNDNFIGRLPQKNNQFPDWSTFYIENRLKPQIRWASEQGRLPHSINKKIPGLYKNIHSICPQEKPALIHGDLWGGNILTTQKGILIIDPCPHFGHREMDLAMMDLFGGFPVGGSSFEKYTDLYPLAPGWPSRVTIYQLYYLLVHLNMFGLGYQARVLEIINRFT